MVKGHPDFQRHLQVRDGSPVSVGQINLGYGFKGKGRGSVRAALPQQPDLAGPVEAGPSGIAAGTIRRPRHHGPVTTWMRCYWAEEDIWFYCEVDTEGWVTRQIELQGPDLTPIAAASLAEWQQAYAAGRLAEYDNRFGLTAELPVSEWEGHEPEQLTFEQFEEIWDSSRRQITARPA